MCQETVTLVYVIYLGYRISNFLKLNCLNANLKIFWLVVPLQKCKKINEKIIIHLININKAKLNCPMLQMTCQNNDKTSGFLFIKVMLKSKTRNKEDIIALNRWHDVKR